MLGGTAAKAGMKEAEEREIHIEVGVLVGLKSLLILF